MNDIAYFSLYLFTNIIHVFLTAVLFMMFARAILSWFPLSNDNPLEEFLYRVTEPFVMPVRAIIERFEALDSLPIDISFFISFILLSVLLEILPELRL